MIFSIDYLQEQLDKFNAQKKYIHKCLLCNKYIIYLDDELKLHNNSICCPYCKHIENIKNYDMREWSMKLVLKNIYNSNINDEEFNV